MTASRAKATTGPTSLTEMARLTGEFADWHNLHYSTMWLTGELDLTALRDAWWRVCLRHDVMRRTYLSADEARTFGDPQSTVEIHTADTDAAAIELMRRTLGSPFRLDGPGFSRVVVVQCGPRRFLFGIAIDHIVNDLTSWLRIRADFTDFYNRALAGDAGDITPVGSYQDFATEQRRLFAGAWGAERRAFWRSYTEEFGVFPPPFPVGAANTGEYRSRTVTRDLPANARSLVRDFARRARATPFAVATAGVLAAAQEVTGDPLVGISVNQHGRTLPGTAQTAGLFVQTVPMHLGKRFGSPHETVRDVFLRTLDVFEYSLPLLVCGRYWNETLMAADKEAGLYVGLNEQPPSSFNLAPFTGTDAEYVHLDFPGGKRWPQTVVVSWNLYETGPQLVAQYNENFLPGDAVERLLTSAERFALQTGGEDVRPSPGTTGQ